MFLGNLSWSGEYRWIVGLITIRTGAYAGALAPGCREGTRPVSELTSQR